MKKVLITGTAGFLASHFAEVMVRKEGYEITGLDKRQTKVECDRKIRSDFVDYIEKYFDIVIHCSAEVNIREIENDPKNAYSENVAKLRKFLRRGNFGKFVFISSGGALFPDQTGVKETDVPEPSSFYGETKLVGEMLVKKYCSDYLIIRPSNIFGERQRYENEGGVIARLLNSDSFEVYNDGEQTRDFIYAKDVVMLVLRAIDLDKRNEVYNASSSEEVSVNDLVKASGKEVPVNNTQIEEARVSSLNNKKAKEELGFSLTENVIDYVERKV